MHVPSATPRRARRALAIALVVSVALPNARAFAQGARDLDSTSVAPGVRVPAGLRGASRAVVDSSDVRRAAALTFSELMQARAASVNVSMSGGRLVDGGQFLVRGPSTIVTEGAPMLIVDGMRMLEEENDPLVTSTRLDDISIDDIERIEVLRGPSAAALYGAGASAGVIVVTTKRGAAGRLRGHVRTIAEGSRDAGRYLEKVRRRPVGSTTSYSCTLSMQAAGVCTPGPLEQWNPLAEGDVFRSGLGGTAALDVAGGTRVSDARLSATVRRAHGISAGDELGHVATRLNVTQRMGERLDVVGRVAYTNDQTKRSNIGEVIDDVPYVSYGPAPLDSFARWASYELSYPTAVARLDHLTAGAELTARAAHWLTLRAAISTDKVSEGAEHSTVLPYGFTTDPNNLYLQPGFDDTHKSLSNTQRSVRATGELTLPMPASLHGSALLLFGAEQERRDHHLRYESLGFYEQSNWYTNPAQFVLGRLAIADRFAFSVGARHESDSGVDGKWDIHPMADVAIRPAERVAGGQMRLRGAYGESAQRVAISSTALTFDSPPGVFSVRMPFPSSERMTEREGGVDLDWGTAGALSATYYNRTVSNVATGQQVPGGFGYTPSVDLASHGVELDARATVLQRGALSWSLRSIVATNSNRVTSGNEYTLPDGGMLIKGYPVGVVARPRYSVNDANGNGIVDPGEVIIGTGFNLGNGSTPTLTLALHSELRFGRRLSLTGVIDRRSGAWTYSTDAAVNCRPPESSCAQYQDPSTPLAEQAAAWLYTNSPSRTAVFDASFTRLRELTLRWTVESRFVRVPGGDAMQIVLSGRNLATWTQWPGPDPEINSLGREAMTRNDVSAVPLPRRVTLGVEVGY